MTTSTFNIDIAANAMPFIWGSSVDTRPFQFVYQAGPFLVSSGPPVIQYTHDALGRLTLVELSNGTTISYAYDSAGNRTQVVTIAGAAGL